MARPKLNIDKEAVFKLAKMHCTMEEMAGFFGCSVDTLERRFADVIDKGRQEGKMKLRDLQLQAANKGNVVMLIWLGKQILGQSEKIESKNENTTSQEIEVNFSRNEIQHKITGPDDTSGKT